MLSNLTTEKTRREWWVHQLALSCVSFVTLASVLVFAYVAGFYVACVVRLFYLGWRLAWGLL